MIGIALYSALYLVLFVLTELVKRKQQLSTELTRKWIHLVSGLLATTMPFYLLKTELLVVCSLFTVVLLISKFWGKLTSLHGVERKTFGEVAFPIGVGVAAYFFLPKNLDLFVFGMLVMSLSDTAAALAGGKWPIFKMKVGSLEKSLGGYLAFALFTFIIAVGCNVYYQWEIPTPLLVGISLVLAKVEALQPYGLDDGTLPLLSGGMVWLVTA